MRYRQATEPGLWTPQRAARQSRQDTFRRQPRYDGLEAQAHGIHAGQDEISDLVGSPIRYPLQPHERGLAQPYLRMQLPEESDHHLGRGLRQRNEQRARLPQQSRIHAERGRCGRCANLVNRRRFLR